MKLSYATLFLVSLVLISAFSDVSFAGSSFCNSKCAVRCSKAKGHEDCLNFCGKCCEQCHCVPSGTYGHKDECPCYRDLKNSKGEPKCP